MKPKPPSQPAANQPVLSQRVIQANARIIWICRQWYVGKMSTEAFRAERKEIFDFIEAQSVDGDSKNKDDKKPKGYSRF